MNKNILIVGAGGHTRSLINLITQIDDEIVGIIDESYSSDLSEWIEALYNFHQHCD